MTNDPTLRWGHLLQVALNQTNPNNLVYIILSTKFTYACQQAGDPNCVNFVAGQPAGLFAVPGWYKSYVFVSFSRGRTWTRENFLRWRIPYRLGSALAP